MIKQLKHSVTLLFLILLAFPAGTQAQQTVDFNKVVTPTETRAREFDQYLVQLAWLNTPDNQIVESERVISEHEAQQAKWQWLDKGQLSVNVNERNVDRLIYINPDPSGNNLVFPILNISASVNLGDIINIPAERKKAAEELKISEHRVNQQLSLIHI